VQFKFNLYLRTEIRSSTSSLVKESVHNEIYSESLWNDPSCINFWANPNEVNKL